MKRPEEDLARADALAAYLPEHLRGRLANGSFPEPGVPERVFAATLFSDFTASSGAREKERELERAKRKIANFVETVGGGRGSKALLDVLRLCETKAEQLRIELALLEKGRKVAFSAPPVVWIEERVRQVHELLEPKTAAAALALRELLGPIRVRPATTRDGKRYLKAETEI